MTLIKLRLEAILIKNLCRGSQAEGARYLYGPVVVVTYQDSGCAVIEQMCKQSNVGTRGSWFKKKFAVIRQLRG